MTTTPTVHPTTSTSRATNSSTSLPTSSSGLSSGAKAGIAVGSILGFAALAGLILLLLRLLRRRHVRAQDSGTNPTYVTTEAAEPVMAYDTNTWRDPPIVTPTPTAQQEFHLAHEQEPMIPSTYASYRPPAFPTIPR
ncbi:hypothetical protein EG329_006299 [Mollisiaceae sp. DMI_Dod_QoI]|nr:hypothetical protein EG329_006299 [Helotiales sp. DMI_Dod_QoI]